MRNKKLANVSAFPVMKKFKYFSPRVISPVKP